MSYCSYKIGFIYVKVGVFLMAKTVSNHTFTFEIILFIIIKAFFGKLKKKIY